MKKVLFGAMLVLLSVTPALAAVPSNPSGLLPQPIGATRFYTQFELHQAQAYRSEPGEFRESPGGASSGSGAAE